jgi:DNA-binding HxlR family transcriptional regulator
MGISKTVLTKCMGELEDLGFIERKLIYHENSKQVKERRIYLCVTPGLKIGNRA